MKHTGLKSKQIAAVLLLGLALSLSSTACRQPSPTGQRYDIKGKVVAVDKTTRTATIAHEDIKGFMLAMTMEFRLKDDAMIQIISPGDQISGSLRVDGISSWLEDIVVTKEGVADTNATPVPGMGPKP